MYENVAVAVNSNIYAKGGRNVMEVYDRYAKDHFNDDADEAYEKMWDDGNCDVDILTIYMKQMGSVDLCSPDEEREFFVRIKAGDEQAKREFAEKNLRLVVSIAKLYRNRGLPFLDLIQEGNLGLLKAIDKFDPEMGYKFSTYATWWIRQGITRALENDPRAVRVSVHMIGYIRKHEKFVKKYELENGREPTLEEIAIELELSEEKVKEIERFASEIVSLDSPIGEDRETALIELIPADEDSIEEAVDKKELKNTLGTLLSQLSERESLVLSLRFGLKDGQQRTLEEVGKHIGVTRERVRQIEAKALRRLRHPSRKEQLECFLP